MIRAPNRTDARSAGFTGREKMQSTEDPGLRKATNNKTPMTPPEKKPILTARALRLTTSQPCRADHPTVRATALTYLIFERPDLDVAARFLTDFGLRVAARQ